jgi:hypothetical protein
VQFYFLLDSSSSLPVLCSSFCFPSVASPASFCLASAVSSVYSLSAVPFSCRWCKTNTLQPCPVFKDLIHCNIQEVKAFGVRDAPIFKDKITERRVIADPPAPDPAPTPTPWLTEKVAVKFVQGANKDAVISVTLREMKEQMLQRGVKGVDECSCKVYLTALYRYKDPNQNIPRTSTF